MVVGRAGDQRTSHILPKSLSLPQKLMKSMTGSYTNTRVNINLVFAFHKKTCSETKSYLLFNALSTNSKLQQMQ